MTTGLDEEQRARLWQEYRANPTPALKSVLVAEYGYLVRRAAWPFLRKKPPTLDFDDLLQAGHEGLLDAIDRFNPERQNLFQTYAMWRIQGQIKDEINSQDWTPRSVRENIRGVIRNIEAHIEENQAQPTDAELAARSQMPLEEIRQVRAQMDKTYMVQADHEMLTLYGPATDDSKAEMQSDVRYVMSKVLTKQEHEYAILKYINGYQNEDIRRRLKLTPQGLKQLRESTVAKLQEGLRGYEGSGH